MGKLLRRTFLVALAMLALLHGAAQAQAPRHYVQAELEALAAPVALYPDALLSDVLAAATYPDQVIEAARLGAPRPEWHPSVNALLSHPVTLHAMARSPDWLFDLGNAYLTHGQALMQAIGALRERARAQASAPRAIRIPQTVYVPVPLPVYVAPPAYVITHRGAPHAHVHAPRQHPPRHHAEPRFPNGPPSPAARMQRGHEPSPAARLQGHKQPAIDFAHPGARKSHDHREAGRRHRGGAAGNAAHAR